jgi:hypothetical protein
MACKNGTCSTPNTCNCAGTSYTIPANAVYGDSTCRTPSEPCSEVTCSECVRNCHQQNKWCTNIQVTDWGGPDGQDDLYSAVEVCMNKGERLDHFLQKLALAQSDPTAYPYMVKNFYISQVTKDLIDIIYYDFSSNITDMRLWFATDGTDDWQEWQSFNSGNPMMNNTFRLILNNSMVSGTTYKLKFITTGPGPNDTINTYDPASVILYVTIP